MSDKSFKTYIENALRIFTVIFLCCFVPTLVIVYLATTSDLALLAALIAGFLGALAGTGTVVMFDLLPKYITYMKTGIFHLNPSICQSFKYQGEKKELYDFIDEILRNDNNHYKSISKLEHRITCSAKSPISTKKERVLSFVFREIEKGEIILTISCSPESKKILFDCGNSLKLVAAFIVRLRGSFKLLEAEAI